MTKPSEKEDALPQAADKTTQLPSAAKTQLQAPPPVVSVRHGLIDPESTQIVALAEVMRTRDPNNITGALAAATGSLDVLAAPTEDDRTRQVKLPEPEFTHEKTPLAAKRSSIAIEPAALAEKNSETQAANTPVPPTETPHSQVIVFFSCKGGSGATTLCTNAAYFYARESRNTCLIDLDLQMGDTLASLSLRPRFTLAQSMAGLKAGQGANPAALPQHVSGVRVLSQVGSVNDLDQITSEGMASLVENLRNSFDVLVIDGVRDFSDNVLAVLDVADKIAVVTVQEMLAVRRARWAFNILRKIGFDPHDITLVINSFDADSPISYLNIKRLFEPSPVVVVPSDKPVVLESLNRGMPLEELQPNTLLTQHINRLAAMLIGLPVSKHQDLTQTEQLPFWHKWRFWGKK